MLRTEMKTLDNLLGGGFYKDDIVLISGQSGSGKTIFATAIMNAFLQKGKAAIYITMEDTLLSYLKSTIPVYDLSEHIDNEQLLILDFPPTEVHQFVDPTNPLRKTVKDQNASIVIIDSIMPLAIAYGKRERITQFLRFISNIRGWDVLTILISEDTPAAKDMLPRTKYGMEMLSDVWIHLYYLWINNKRKRMLEVMKARGRNHKKGPLDFDITEKGIILGGTHED